MGAFFFGFLTTAIANPNNEKPVMPDDGSSDHDKLMPKNVGEMVPHMFRVCLIIWVILGLTSVFGVFRNPHFIKNEKVRVRHETLNDIN